MQKHLIKRYKDFSISKLQNIITEKDVGDVFTIEEKIQQASNAFNNYIKSLGKKRYNDASQALQDLENALKDLSEQGAFSPGSE